MRITCTCDAEANAAYLYLKPISPGGVAETLELTDAVNLDVDKDGFVLGLDLDATAFFGDFSAVFGHELALPERIDRETFAALQRSLDDAQDLAALREAKAAEGDEPGVPIEEVKKQLGLA